MKISYTSIVLLAGLFSVSIITNSCAKTDHSSDLPKEQQVVGYWSINRIQLKIFTGGVFIKDTIVTQTPHPVNFVTFDAGGNIEYKFNTYTSDIGTYQFIGADSMISNTNTQIYRWKMLTLTNKLFTVVTNTTDPAYPGSVIERYQTFVR